MSENSTKLKASCECGNNHYELKGQPIARFVCHCEVCQQFTNGPYSDVTVAFANDVNIGNISDTTFKRMKAPPNIRRGVCTKCNKPSIEFGILDQLAFIPVSCYEKPEELPSPSIHAFYHRRVKDIDDSLPKHEGFFKSQIAIINLLGKSLFKRI